MNEKLSSNEIEHCVQESLVFEYSEIAELLFVYNMPAWPKSMKKMRIEMIERMILHKVGCLEIVNCSYDEIKDFSKFMVEKCLFTCDVAEYAEKIPLIGRMIQIGKFPLVLSAMRSATKEYAKRRNYGYSSSQSQDYAKQAYWNDILDSLDMIF